MRVQDWQDNEHTREIRKRENWDGNGRGYIKKVNFEFGIGANRGTNQSDSQGPDFDLHNFTRRHERRGERTGREPTVEDAQHNLQRPKQEKGVLDSGWMGGRIAEMRRKIKKGRRCVCVCVWCMCVCMACPCPCHCPCHCYPLGTVFITLLSAYLVLPGEGGRREERGSRQMVGTGSLTKSNGTVGKETVFTGKEGRKEGKERRNETSCRKNKGGWWGKKERAREREGRHAHNQRK